MQYCLSLLFLFVREAANCNFSLLAFEHIGIIMQIVHYWLILKKN